MKIGIAIARATAASETWTTIHLARAALDRGHQVRFIEPWDFQIDRKHRLLARAHMFNPPSPSASDMVSALTGRLAERTMLQVDKLDLLMLRIAPLHPSVLTFALLAKEAGVRVVNDPVGIVQVSHKSWLASIPGAPTPETLITRSRGATFAFFESQPDGVVLKPARGSGGRRVSFVESGDEAGLDAAFGYAARGGDGYVVVQGYIREADQGEKRLMVLDGELLGGYLRRRAPGEFRHNLKQGGHAEAIEITESDREIARVVSAPLRNAGLRLAGLDVIGGKIIEVNATNPGGAFHTDRLTGTKISDKIIAAFEH